jgi:aspartate beta-hydroxylase
MEQQSIASMVAAAEDAVRNGDTGRALDILTRAESLAPGEASVHLSRALAYRSMGNSEAALESLETVLALEPRNFLALLSKGFLLEQQGFERKAATVYRSALAVTPPADRVPPALAGAVERARQAVVSNSEALRTHLQESLAETRARFGEECLDRFDESVDILTGKTRAYVQQPLLLHYPRLPPIPFFERELFPWLAELEAQTGAIQEDLRDLLDEVGTEPFAPYIAYPPGAPLDQWGALNHSRRWSSFFFWRDGVRHEEACARCPRTAAALEAMPMARQPRLAPTAMFSVLEAHTEIPPHTGSTNIRAVVHLPLLLPGRCRFRVGNVTREWRMNEAWVFDDTIEHQAWNDSSELRVILIFDVWNPFLSEAERVLVTDMLRARSEFQAG